MYKIEYDCFVEGSLYSEHVIEETESYDEALRFKEYLIENDDLYYNVLMYEC